MKKTLLFVLAFLLILLGALLVVPRFVDWNAYRRDVAAAIVQATGREVTIAGDLDLSILPLPRLTVRRISVASVAGAVDRELLRIGELRMELAVAPLMAGRIAVRSLSLIDPVLTLETTADGRRSWEFTPVEPSRAPGRLASEIPVDTVLVANGVLAWREAGGQRRQLNAIEATFTAGGPTGSTRVRGTAAFNDIPFRFLASVGRAETNDLAPFSATIDIHDGVAEVAATGRLDWKRRSAGGTVRVTSPDAKTLGLALTGGTEFTAPTWNIAGQSTFSADRDVIALPDIVLTYGEIRGTGRARLVLDEGPALSAELVIGMMNLDRVVAAADGEGRADRGPGNAGLAGKSFDHTVDFTADLDLSVKAVRWRDGVIRDIGATVHLGPRGIAIDRLAMKLPGGTDVTLSGIQAQGESGAPLRGDLAVISDNLRGTLVWAGAATEDLPSDRLRSLSFTSRIAIAPDAVHLASIAARLDATRMTGAATIARQARPSFGVRLDLDRLDLDAYLPDSVGPERDVNETDGSGIRLARLFDANLVVSARHLTLGGIAASQLSLDAQLFDGDVRLRKLAIGDLGDAALTVTGTVRDLPGTPTGDLTVALHARDTERFVGLFDVAPWTLASRIGGFRLDGHLSGTVRRAAVSGTLAVAGGEVQAEGTLTDLDKEAAFDLAMAVSHPDSDEVFNLLAADRPNGGIGPMTATFGVTGTADTLALGNLEAAVGDMKIAGRIDIAYGGTRPLAVASLSAESLDMDRLLPAALRPAADMSLAARRGSAHWSRQPIDLSVLRTLDLDLTLRSDEVRRGGTQISGFDVHTVLADGVLTIDRLTGRLFGGSIEASGRIDATTSSPLFAATVSGRDIAARRALSAVAEFDRLEGPVAFSVSLSAMGATPYEVVSSLWGKGTLSGSVTAQRHGSRPIPAGAAGDALAKLLKAFALTEAALSGEFRVVNGTASTSNLSLVGGEVQTLTQGTADLSGWRMDSTTTLRRAQGGDHVPELVIKLSGPLDDPAVRLSGAAIADDEDAAPVPEAAPVTPVEPVPPAMSIGQEVP